MTRYGILDHMQIISNFQDGASNPATPCFFDFFSFHFMKVQSFLYPQMKFQLCVMLFSYSIDLKKQWPSDFATCVHGPKVNVYHDNSRAQHPRTHSSNGRKYTKAHKIVLGGRDLPDSEGRGWRVCP